MYIYTICIFIYIYHISICICIYIHHSYSFIINMWLLAFQDSHAGITAETPWFDHRGEPTCWAKVALAPSTCATGETNQAGAARPTRSSMNGLLWLTMAYYHIVVDPLGMKLKKHAYELRKQSE